ncbi:acetyltransferase [Xylaria intraflava]|nr:acetyltransferase [Xylaria intraflava]
MSGAPTFHVRELGEGSEDVQFMMDAFDSTLPRLAAIGSGGQWGSVPASERSNVNDLLKSLGQARRYRSTGEGDPIWFFIIETEIPSTALDELPASVHVRTSNDKKFLAVGCVKLSEGICPHYIRGHFDKDIIRKELEGNTDYLYLEALITDYRTGSWRKGSGAALVEYSRHFCRGRGKTVLYLDAYAGNDGKLVKWYETQGFSVVIEVEHPTPTGSKWPGAILRMDVIEQ